MTTPPNETERLHLNKGSSSEGGDVPDRPTPRRDDEMLFVQAALGELLDLVDQVGHGHTIEADHARRVLARSRSTARAVAVPEDRPAPSEVEALLDQWERDCVDNAIPFSNGERDVLKDCTAALRAALGDPTAPTPTPPPSMFRELERRKALAWVLDAAEVAMHSDGDRFMAMALWDDGRTLEGEWVAGVGVPGREAAIDSLWEVVRSRWPSGVSEAGAEDGAS